MPVNMSKCRVTVLKRMVNQDVADQYLDTSSGWGACDQFQEGQEIILENPYRPPEGFCRWAWADIRGEILAIMAGANYP